MKHLLTNTFIFANKILIERKLFICMRIMGWPKRTCNENTKIKILDSWKNISILSLSKSLIIALIEQNWVVIGAHLPPIVLGQLKFEKI